MEVSGLAEEADKVELGGSVCIERTGDEEVGKCDAVSGLLPAEGINGSERRGGDVRAEIVIRDNGEDDVEGGCKAL